MLSLQAAASRLLYSFARDGMLPPGHRWLSQVTPRTKVPPANALIVACTVPVLLALLIFVNEDLLNSVTAFAVLGIYVAFQMVVLAALRQRIKGWRPAGPFSLGRWGVVVNALALAYGGVRDVPPREARRVRQPVHGLDRADRPGGSCSARGLLYLFLARPPDRKSTAAAGDAIAVAEEIRARTGAVRTLS